MKTIFKRRREKKTNYSKRKELLKGNFPRVVFRKTNKYLIGQYVVSHEAQDKIEIGVNSKHLEKYGWPKEFEGSLKSIPASYLTGFLLGKRIVKEKKTTPIFDFGMIRSVHKTKPFAFLKGLIDAGVNISNKKEEVFPEEDRIKGKSLKKDFSVKFDEIKSKIGKE